MKPARCAIWILTLVLMLTLFCGGISSAGTDRAGGHDSIGVSSPATTWYLAEGSTGGTFETWVLVMNPGTAPAKVRLTYMTPSAPVRLAKPG